MRKTIFILILLFQVFAGYGQTIFENGEGEAIFLKNADFKPWYSLRVNTSSESFAFAFNRTLDTGQLTNDKKQYISKLIGINFKVKTNSGLANVVSSGKFSTGLSLTGTLGRLAYVNADSGKANNPSSRYLSISISYDKNTLLDQANLEANDIEKLSVSADYHWNKLWTVQHSEKKWSYSIFSVSGGYKLDNNLDGLDEGVAATSIGSRPGFNIVTNETGKIGVYQRYHTFPVAVDYGFIPRIFGSNMLGFNVFGRGRFNYPNSPVNLGTGLFFTKKGQPTNVLGGIGWQFTDVFNKGDQLKNAPVFVYIGYTID